MKDKAKPFVDTSSYLAFTSQSRIVKCMLTSVWLKNRFEIGSEHSVEVEEMLKSKREEAQE